MSDTPDNSATVSGTVNLSPAAWSMLTGIATVLRCSRTEIVEELIAQRFAELTGRETR